MLPSPRRVAATRFALILAAGAIVSTVVLLGREALFGRGPTAIHDSARLGERIHVCGRDYRGGTIVTREAFGRVSPFVLVDPAPFAPCEPVVDDPTSVCTTGGVICGTWTVVLVRVGEDAYSVYELLGGP